MNRSWRRFAAYLGSICAVALAAAAGAQAASKAAQRLVDTYSPIVMLRAQEHPPCDNHEEQYQPTTVNVVLGNPAVRLIPPPGRDPPRPVERAPTAADIAGRGQGWHLDLPGNPLEPGCTYARDFAAIEKAGEAPIITYAHVRRQPGVRGLFVQYWFYYYFNQFNDLHESDWEGMQIAFGANAPRNALAAGPTEVALFQHSGGETADWDGDKLERRGNHPVVYPAAGSHATFYDSTIYIENGQRGSGLGCDNASEPSRAVRPRPVVVPTNPRPGSRFEWLTYEGPWGQREGGFNNGPTGPNTKPKWLTPSTSMSLMRSSSAKLPGHSILGPAVTSAFCVAVAEVSRFLNLAAASPPGAIALVVAAFLLLVVPAWLTRWRPAEVKPLRQARAFGQLLLAAGRLYWRHSVTLVLLGLTAVPILGVVHGLHSGLAEATGDSELTAAIGSANFRLAYSGAIAALGSIVGYAIVGAAVITFVRELDRGQPVGFVGAYRALLPRFWRAALCHLAATLLVLLIALTVVGIPIAIKKYVDWQFVQQEILFKDRRLRDAFRGSSELVRGQWWHTLSVAGFLWILSRVAGPVLGFAMVFADFSLTAINLFGSLVFALLIPFVALARTLLYFDLAAREQEAPGHQPERVRRWLARRRPSPQPS